jgi:hemerythrin
MLHYEDCRPYVQHLLTEHRRLHTMLRLARSAIRQCCGPDRDATTADIVRVLKQVRDELSHHFADEEAGGCIEEAVSRCPSISPQASRVQSEHPELLRQLDALLAQVSDSEQTVAGRITVQRQFDELCRQLHAHEAAENDLLRQAFGVNVNGDVNGCTPLPLDA